MSEFLEKLSSYNLFNYLFPGVVFCLLADKVFSFSLIQEDMVVGIFLYYFVGLVISRIGSLIIEPVLKKIGFIAFADFSDFLSASKNDPKIETLSEVNDMYRTIVSLVFSLTLIAVYQIIESKWPIFADYSNYIVIIFLFCIFLYSYRKQTDYVVKRIGAAKEKDNSNR